MVAKEDRYEKLMQKMDKIINQTLIVPKELGLESEDYEYSNRFLKEIPKPLAPIPLPKPEPKPKTTIKKPAQKPKLCIIIDDISSFKEIRELNKANLKLTYSLFPPTTAFPNTPKIAKRLKFYMVHLPLGAYHFKREQENTLKVCDSMQKIEAQIKKIRKLFPRATFVNNHTGSKFTDNLEAMKKLFKALKKYHFIFVDSKTIPTSKAHIVANLFNQKLLIRDIFIDNKPDVTCIISQLKKAVQKAKKNGSAIAIGHPRKATITALKSSKNYLKM